VTAERGSATVEMVLLVPLLVVLVMSVVHAGRSAEALVQLRHAADQGARAASMVRTDRMEDVGERAVRDDLVGSGSSCTDPLVNVAVDGDSAVRAVMVEIECTVRIAGLELLGVRTRRLEARSTEVIDLWRAG
jgi:Flp pilus assembly protein TadG